MKVYILGITGLLGSELFLRFIKGGQHLVKGSTRKHELKEFPILNQYKKNIDFGIDLVLDLVFNFMVLLDDFILLKKLFLLFLELFIYTYYQYLLRY